MRRENFVRDCSFYIISLSVLSVTHVFTLFKGMKVQVGLKKKKKKIRNSTPDFGVIRLLDEIWYSNSSRTNPSGIHLFYQLYPRIIFKFSYF